MKPERIFYLVMYDITHGRTLQKVAKLLIKAGLERINYSVFLGWENPLANPLLKERVQKLLKQPEAEGSLFYVLPVNRRELKQMKGINGRKPKNLDYWVGEEQTMFL
jgi:CRISPR-associated endonuclease Cas2